MDQWLRSSGQDNPGEALIHLLRLASAACENFSTGTGVSRWAACHSPFCLLPPMSLQFQSALNSPERNRKLIPLV